MNTAIYTKHIEPLPVKVTGDSAQLTFNPHVLRELGFTDNGPNWSNTNEQYNSLDTQIGTLCVVGYSHVYLIHSNKEEHLARINSVRMLSFFIQMLS